MSSKEIFLFNTKKGNIYIEIYPKNADNKYLISVELNNITANVMSTCKQTGIKEAMSYFK